MRPCTAAAVLVSTRSWHELIGISRKRARPVGSTSPREQCETHCRAARVRLGPQGPSAIQRAKVPAVADDRPLVGPAAAGERECSTSPRWQEKAISMQAGAKTRSREVERTENAVFGALMAAFMGVSPFVANAAGRRADATLARAARAQRA